MLYQLVAYSKNIVSALAFITVFTVPLHLSAEVQRPLNTTDEVCRKISQNLPSHWQHSDTPQTYSATELWKYLDGADTLYLSHGCRWLCVFFLKSLNNGEVTLELYSFPDSLRVFGIFCRLIPHHSSYVYTKGSLTWTDASQLLMVRGHYLVRLNFYQSGEKNTLRNETFTRYLSKIIHTPWHLPKQYRVFPGKAFVDYKPSYIHGTVLSFPFLHSGIAATYSKGKSDNVVILVDTVSVKQAKSHFFKIQKRISQDEKCRIEGSSRDNKEIDILKVHCSPNSGKSYRLTLFRKYLLFEIGSSDAQLRKKVLKKLQTMQ